MTSPRRERSRTRPPTAPWVLAAVLTVTLAVAFASKLDCRWQQTGAWWSTAWCYSDLADLWDDRGFDARAVPYRAPPAVDHAIVEGELSRSQEPHSTFEYPPVLGFGAWAVSLVTSSQRGFYVVNAAALAVAGVLTVWFLDRILQERAADRDRWLDSRVRLLGFVASPTLLTLAFQNWDLWSTAPVAAGLYAAVRRRPVVAGAWFGLAAGVKWWPALLVVPLLAGPWAVEDRGPRRRLAPLGSFAGVWALVQVPALLVSVDGWWESIAFHLERGPNRASLIGVVAHVGRALSDSALWWGTYARVSTAVTFVALVTLAVVVLRRLHDRRLDPAVAAFVLVAVFLVVSKVVSVQFVLWLLPVAVIAGVRWWPILVVDGLNAAVWLLWSPSGDDGSALFWTSLAVASARTLLLAGIALQALRREPSPRRGGGLVAQPAGTR